MALEVDLKQYVKTYGEHTLVINVTGDGFRKSEDITYTYESKPFIKSYIDHIHVSNIQENVSQIDFYVDGALWKSIEHDITSTDEMDIDYSDTPITPTSDNAIYLNFITTYGEFKSNETRTAYTEITTEDISTTYKFKLDTSDGFYKPNNQSKDSTYATIRLNITHTGRDQNLVIYWRQSTESGYDFGLIGNKSVALSQSADADSSVLKSFKGQTATTEQKFTIQLEAGTCFYDIKYRKDGSQSSGWDRFDFRYEIEEIE